MNCECCPDLICANTVATGHSYQDNNLQNSSQTVEYKRVTKKCLIISVSVGLVLLATIIGLSIVFTRSRDNVPCPSVPSVKYATIACTKDNSPGSACTTSCVTNHIISGSNLSTCESNGVWSNPFPECVCPRCMAGDECQHTASYQKSSLSLKRERNSTSLLAYGGSIIKCSDWVKRSHNKDTDHGCTCSDQKTGLSAECSAWHTPLSACVRASSKLIRELSPRSDYTSPCDWGSLEEICDSSGMLIRPCQLLILVITLLKPGMV